MDPMASSTTKSEFQKTSIDLNTAMRTAFMAVTVSSHKYHP